MFNQFFMRACMEPIFQNQAHLTLSKKRKDEMKLVYCGYPFEILDNIASYLPEENKYGYGRVENISLWVRVAQVCQDFRWWVFCSEKGPFKLSESKIIPLIISHSSTTLRCFLGVLNQERVKLVGSAFEYVTRPDDHPEQHAISTLSPYVKNYEGESLIEKVISGMSSWHKKDDPLLKMFFSKMSPEELVNHIQIFIKQKIPYGNHIRLFELLFDEIKKRKGEDLAKAAFQPFLGNLLCVDYCSSVTLFLEWILKKGMKLNIENLFNCFSNEFDWQEKKLFPIIEKIINLQPEIRDQTTPSGDRLIHILLKGQKTTAFKMYLELILNGFPLEIIAKDREGKSAISYLFENQNCVKKSKNSCDIFDYTFITKNYIESDLWDIREECFQLVLQFIRKDRLNLLKSSEQAEIFLLSIKKAFEEEEKFDEWLTSLYGEAKECFMYQLATLSFSLAYKMSGYLELDYIDDIVHSLEDLSDRRSSNWDRDHQYWENIKENFSKYPDFKESLYLELFGENVRRHTCDKEFTAMNKILDSNWVNFIDHEGNTLLHHLFSIKLEYYGSMKRATIAYMMDHGFDPEVKNNAGETVADLAIKNGWNDLLPLLQ